MSPPPAAPVRRIDSALLSRCCLSHSPRSAAVTAPRVHELRATACAYDVVANTSSTGGSTYGGSNDVDARRLLLSASADGEMRVSAAACGAERWRWPAADDNVARAVSQDPSSPAATVDLRTIAPMHVALTRDALRAVVGCERFAGDAAPPSKRAVYSTLKFVVIVVVVVVSKSACFVVELAGTQPRICDRSCDE